MFMTDGSICLDILQNRWSPTYDVSSILTSIQSLLDEPNPNNPRRETPLRVVCAGGGAAAGGTVLRRDHVHPGAAQADAGLQEIARRPSCGCQWCTI